MLERAEMKNNLRILSFSWFASAAAREEGESASPAAAGTGAAAALATANCGKDLL